MPVLSQRSGRLETLDLEGLGYGNLTLIQSPKKSNLGEEYGEDP